ncbi:PI-PLC X domain-containing protein 3-like [Tachypleus tridentatus]|uniref:PI-PLC X domain-containing protein 3-like n=1 Tax=Tachypleus tridentatus TaxID=6853 RepID=UPI003FD35280
MAEGSVSNLESYVKHEHLEVERANLEHKIKLDHWMENLPENLHHVPLYCLAIPGSHESGSYSIDPHSEFSPEEHDRGKSKMLHLVGNMTRKVIYNWRRTQDITCQKQLLRGIRYFSFSVAPKEGSSEIFIVCGLYGIPVSFILADIKEFMDSHPKEIILIDFEHFFEMTNEHHEKLMKQVTEAFGSKVCPYPEDLEQATLAWMWQQEYQVITFYRHEVAKDHPFLWVDCIEGASPDALHISDLIFFLSQNYLRERNDRTFYVSKGHLTPTVAFILRHPRSCLKDMLVSTTHAALYQWLKEKTAGKYGLNIVTCDFVESHKFHFCFMVVEVNYYELMIAEHDKKKKIHGRKI